MKSFIYVIIIVVAILNFIEGYIIGISKCNDNQKLIQQEAEQIADGVPPRIDYWINWQYVNKCREGNK